MSAQNGSLETICELHSQSTQAELEMRFGSRGPRITRIEFDLVIAKLKAEGFQSSPPKYFLRIQNEYADPKSGQLRLSNIRTTVTGMQSIQTYCNTNDIPVNERGEVPPYVTFETKGQYRTDGGENIRPVDMNDWGIRVSLQKEETITTRDGRVKQTLSEWSRSRKVFRLIKRFSFTHPAYNLRADLSVVRSSPKGKTGRLIPQMTYLDANVSSSPESFEIELEVTGTQSLAGTTIADLRRVSKIVLSGIQDSNYPIPMSVQDDVASSYYTMVNGNALQGRVKSRDFIGPSSVSLEIPNISTKSDSTVSVLSGYAATDKADGLRKMMYIGPGGKIYLIDTNMRIQFSGLVAGEEWEATLIDGEHIIHDKFGVYYNKYAAFDCYFVKGKDVRPDSLISLDKKEGRLRSLATVISECGAKPIVPGGQPLILMRKAFYTDENIFANCAAVNKKIKDGAMEYETDGLMLTPIALPVGAEGSDDTPPNKKRTWTRSFKWKPPEHNTIDFLCTTVKTPSGDDETKTVFSGGLSMTEEGVLIQYKSIVLRVGYDERRHGYLSPCQQVIEGDYPTSRQSDRVSEYKPAPFRPTNPSDSSASLCNIMIDDVTGLMMTENKNEVIEDMTIVEFRYEANKDAGWRWVPIKVRYDKTADLRNGGRNYGNAYHVAESVWTSIHNPITTEMITTGTDIPDVMSDTYYLSSGASTSSPMRDFHNFCIKRKLLLSVIRPGNSVLDLGAGKAGDLHKWIAARAGLVLGIDSCEDCIENRIDGACARYLNSFTKYKSVPPMFFLYGEASQSIKGGEALLTAIGKRTMRALLGEGPRDSQVLGQAVYRNYGRAKDGFNVISSQFALHYFFRDIDTFNGLLDNISDLCADGGYFVGSCYDGKRVFRALEEKDVGDGLCMKVLSNTICEITKRYESTTYHNDETCLGYAIDVYQDSINNQIREYLVNFSYLESRLAERGIRPVSTREAQGLGLLGGIVPFADIFQQVQLKVANDARFKKNIGSTLDMTDQERKVSFLNNMFAFKKATARRRKGVKKLVIVE